MTTPPVPRPVLGAFRRRSVRYQLTLALVAGMALPVLVMLLWGRFFVDRVRQDAEHDLYDATRSVARVLDAQVAEHLRAVTALALALDGRRFNRAEVTAALARTRRTYPGFLGMVAADAAGQVLVLNQSRDSVPAAATRGLSIADRAYFREPMADGRPHVSEVYRGRGPARAPVVTLSAAVSDASGRRVGLVAGSLDLEGFRRLERENTFLAPAARVVIADRHGHVVYGGRDRRYPLLEDLSATPLASLAATSSPVFEFTDDLSGVRTAYLVGHVVSPELGWHIYVSQPAALVWRDVRLYRIGMAAAIGIALLVLGFAFWLLERHALRPLEQLVGALRQFSVVEPQRELPLPREAPAEIAELVDSFELMSQRIGTVLSGVLPICASCKRIRNHMGGWESVEAFVRDRTDAEFSHTVCPDCHHRLYPDAGG
jgi:hypothetical protein